MTRLHLFMDYLGPLHNPWSTLLASREPFRKIWFTSTMQIFHCGLFTWRENRDSDPSWIHLFLSSRLLPWSWVFWQTSREGYCAACHQGPLCSPRRDWTQLPIGSLLVGHWWQWFHTKILWSDLATQSIQVPSKSTVTLVQSHFIFHGLTLSQILR